MTANDSAGLALVGATEAGERTGTMKTAPLAVVLTVASCLLVWTLAANAQAPQFDVASIKRNTSGSLSSPIQNLQGEVRMLNASVRSLILRAYPLASWPIEIQGLPPWADIQGEKYDVIARHHSVSSDQTQGMWRLLLADRMKLRAHYEVRERRGYELVLARTDGTLGPNIKPSALDCSGSPPELPPASRGLTPGETIRSIQHAAMNRCGLFVRGDTVTTGGAPLSQLIRFITSTAGRPIADNTGLEGWFAFSLRFQRGGTPTVAQEGPEAAPGLFTALQEQLAMKLTETSISTQILVVDHIERPTAN